MSVPHGMFDSFLTLFGDLPPAYPNLLVQPSTHITVQSRSFTSLSLSPPLYLVFFTLAKLELLLWH